MKALRKKANEMGLPAQAGPAKRPRASATTTPVKKAKLNKNNKETDDRDSDEDGNVPVTPKSSSEDSGSIVTKNMTPSPSDAKNQVRLKSRVSPRKAAKKDYKSLGDPYQAMENTQDSNGERIFEHEKSDSEDSAASDGEFAGAPKTEPVMEI